MAAFVASREQVRQTPRVAVQLHRSWSMLLLPADALVQVAVEPSVAPIPNCAAWFPGVLGRRGTIVPIFDVATWAGERQVDIGSTQFIVVDAGPRSFALLCSAAPEVVEAEQRAGTRLEGLPERLHPYLPGAMNTRETFLATFDVRRWIADAAPTLTD